jgi:hypothetical protein
MLGSTLSFKSLFAGNVLRNASLIFTESKGSPMNHHKFVEKFLLLTTILLVLIARSGIAQVPANAERILTLPDLEKVGGPTGVVLMPHDEKKDQPGVLKFGRKADRHAVLTLGFQAASDLAHMKEYFSKTFKPVKDIGEEAYSNDVMQLIFRKGRYTVVLTSGIDSGTMKPFYGQPQLQKLGKLIASRL